MRRAAEPAVFPGEADEGQNDVINRRITVSRFGGPEVLLLLEEQRPQPDPGQVLVRVLAAGVSYADLLMREGVHPEVRKPPFSPGWDLVGRVTEVGEGVTSLDEGQLVAGLPVRGAYADYVCMGEQDLVPVPPGLDPAEAVTLVLNYVTAYQMMHRSVAASAGHEALIHSAAGGVGLGLLQLGSLVGMRMFGTASPAKKDIVSKYGWRKRQAGQRGERTSSGNSSGAGYGR